MNVNVADGEGVELGVSEGRNVWVAVTVAVGEGGGRNVQVGSVKMVGAGCVINVRLAHPTENRVTSAMKRVCLFKFLEYMIQISDTTPLRRNNLTLTGHAMRETA